MKQLTYNHMLPCLFYPITPNNISKNKITSHISTFRSQDTWYNRAFSDLFGKFLVPMILGKNCVILGKNMTILGKKSAIFNKIGKVYLLNLDFSASWECPIFSANWEKIWYQKPDPVLYREKALYNQWYKCTVKTLMI